MGGSEGRGRAQGLRRWAWRSLVFTVTMVGGFLGLLVVCGTKVAPPAILVLAVLAALGEGALAGVTPASDGGPVDLQCLRERAVDLVLSALAVAVGADLLLLTQVGKSWFFAYYFILFPLLFCPGLAVELAGRLRGGVRGGTLVRLWRAAFATLVVLIGVAVLASTWVGSAGSYALVAIAALVALALFEALVFEATSPVEAVLRVPLVLGRRYGVGILRRGLPLLGQVGVLVGAGAAFLALAAVLSGITYVVATDVYRLARTPLVSATVPIPAALVLYPIALVVLTAGLTAVLDAERRRAVA